MKQERNERKNKQTNKQSLSNDTNEAVYDCAVVDCIANQRGDNELEG